jgi:F-type H+-transporting ATPase subunit epsilon
VAGLRLILVTPEKTLFDESVKSVRLPMFDGSAGFYPGRAPLVGRLGIGEMVCTTESGSNEAWLIDNGFVQVKGKLVSVLTEEAIPQSDLKRSEARSAIDEAKAMDSVTDEEFAAAERKLERARQMLRLASHD